jgi:nucleotide-binding universal stress UspA family protein
MMSFLHRVLIPLDGSRESDLALDAVGPLFRFHHPEVLLLGVMKPDSFDYGLRTHLDHTANRLREKGINAVPVLGRGIPQEEILAFAGREDVDLVAMATSARTGLERIIGGSVAEDVIRHAEIPVLVCRPGAVAADWSRIMVALDGSERAEEILKDAGRLAQEQDATLDVVRVAMPLVTASGLGEVPLVLPGDDPLPYLRGVRDRLEAEGVRVRAVGLEGRAAAQLLNYATENRVGLLCLTTHGRNGVARLLLGSVAEEVLRHAPCPVLLRRMVRIPDPAGKESAP